MRRYSVSPGQRRLRKYISQFTDFTVCQIEEYMNKKNTMLVHRIVQYMNEHMDDSTLSLAKISKINYINNSYLSRTFKVCYGNQLHGLSGIHPHRGSQKASGGTDF